MSVLNPSFSTGSLAPWFFIGNPITAQASSPPYQAHTAPFAAFFSTNSTLVQTVSGFTIGETYILTFYANALVTLNFLTVTIGDPGEVTITAATATNPVGPSPATPIMGNAVPTSVPPTGPLPSDYVFYQITFIANVTSLDLFFLNSLNSNSLFLDDINITLVIVCYSGNSLVYTKDTKTGIIDNTKASEVYAGIHQVYDINSKEFVPVKCNITTGLTKRYMKLEKGCLGENQPSEDFYVTSGHKIIINGVETKAGRIPEAKRAKVKPETVYSICTEKRIPILINNLYVIAESYDTWKNYATKKGIVWKDNTLIQY